MKLHKTQFEFLSGNINSDLIGRLKYTTNGNNVLLVDDKIIFNEILDELTVKLMSDGIDEESNINSFGKEIESLIDIFSPVIYD
jgi:hypothetical protein